MAAVTWRNIAPIDTSGILDSVNTAGRQIGTGIAGIGDALTGYADDRTTSETDILRHALLQAADEKAKEEIMASQDMSFIDKGVLADIEKEKQDAILKEATWQKHTDTDFKNSLALAKAKANTDTNINISGTGQFGSNYENLTGENLSTSNALELSAFEQGLRQHYPHLTNKQIKEFMTKDVTLRQDFFTPNNFTFEHKGQTYDFGGADWLSTKGKFKAANAIITQRANDNSARADAFKQWQAASKDNKTFTDFEKIWTNYYNNHTEESLSSEKFLEFIKSLNSK